MGDGAEPQAPDARGGVWARRAARRRGHHHEGHLPVAEVRLYTATGCHLCEAARRVVIRAQEELGFELREIPIDGDRELEASYREWIPVVEIDGRRRFVHHVHPDALRRAIAQAAAEAG